MEKIKFPRVGEEMYHEKLENGLNVFVFPKAGFQKVVDAMMAQGIV